MIVEGLLLRSGFDLVFMGFYYYFFCVKKIFARPVGFPFTESYLVFFTEFCLFEGIVFVALAAILLC